MVRVFNVFQSIEEKHHDQLVVSSSEGIISYALAVLYVVLPIIVMGLYNEIVAGFFLGGFNLVQAFVFNPVSGALTDKFGAKNMLIMSSLILAIGAVFFFFMPISPLSIIVFAVVYFIGYSLRVADTYILRVTDKSSGGLMFGLYEDLRAIAFFLSTLSIPFFVVSRNYKLAGVVLLAVCILNIYMLLKVKTDLKQHKKISLAQAFSIFYTVKGGINFIKKNKGFPMLAISSAAFEGFFFGVIWFLFPVHFVNTHGSSFLSSMQLGIYELVTILFAGYAGYLADKHQWNKTLKAGWIMTIIGVGLMPVFPSAIGLIIIGIMIGIGNNLFFFSAQHILEKHDLDHREDGEFMALKNITLDACYGIAPIIAGILYGLAGFQVTLLAMAVFIILVGGYSLVLMTRLMRTEKRIFFTHRRAAR